MNKVERFVKSILNHSSISRAHPFGRFSQQNIFQMTGVSADFTFLYTKLIVVQDCRILAKKKQEE